MVNHSFGKPFYNFKVGLTLYQVKYNELDIRVFKNDLEYKLVTLLY